MRLQSDMLPSGARQRLAGSDGDLFLYVHRDADDPVCGSVDLCGLTAAFLSRLQLSQPTPSAWQSWFSVFVGTVDQVNQDERPAVLGQYAVVDTCVRFTPRYPLMKGLSYQARINLAPFAEGDRTPVVRWLPFSTLRHRAAAETGVETVVPSGEMLPENTLRFYIHFSAPMQYGLSRKHIALVGPDGRPVEGAFLDLATELWDPAMRRLTVLLHPGRIKRGVGANMEVGPALVAGQRYCIVVGDGMLDSAGRRLKHAFSKSFIAVPAVRQPIDPQQWGIELPMPETRQPLVLTFPHALDHAILRQSLRVQDADQRPVVGNVAIAASERRWMFSPECAWRHGLHQILIDQRLEDICGNTIAAPFDIGGDAKVARARSPNPYVLPFQLGLTAD